MTVRPSREDDLPRITAIYAEAVLHGLASFEIEPPSLTEMARRREATLGAGFPHLVHDDGGGVRGYGYLGLYRPRPAYRFTLEDSIYVDPAAHGRGVGRALLAALVAWAETGGYRQMIAVIGDSGNAASIGLHRALGFAPAGVLAAVGWKHGRWVDSVLMQRPLGPGAASSPES